MPYANPDVINWLRSAHVLDVRETIREARLCIDGWDYYDEDECAVCLEEDAPEEFVADGYARSLLGGTVCHVCDDYPSGWRWTAYPPPDGRPSTSGTAPDREAAERAAEDAAIALGWRVAWRRP